MRYYNSFNVDSKTDLASRTDKNIYHLLAHSAVTIIVVTIQRRSWATDIFWGGGQSRTQSNACSRVRLALALGERNELRMISYALT